MAVEPNDELSSKYLELAAELAKYGTYRDYYEATHRKPSAPITAEEAEAPAVGNPTEEE